MPQWNDKELGYQYMQEFWVKMNEEYNSEAKRSVSARGVALL